MGLGAQLFVHSSFWKNILTTFFLSYIQHIYFKMDETSEIAHKGD